MSEIPKNSQGVLRNGKGIGGNVRGPALVSQDGFGVRYDLDPDSGVISNPEHDLYGQSIGGQILVCTSPKGGVAASWALANLKDHGIAPLAMIFRRTSPIFVQGALFAEIPIMHNLEGDPCTLIRTGDDIELFPREGRVVIYR